MSSDLNDYKRTGKLKRWCLSIFLILAALVLVGVAVYKFCFQRPELPKVEEGDPVVIVDPETGETTTQPESEIKINGERKSEDFYTILLVGTDTSSNSTDTIMLISYDVTNQAATVMSIPRDTLVSTFGIDRYTRINTIYSAYGGGESGREALTHEVSELVGFIPDYRVFVSWELVGHMVDAIGGVEYDVPFHMEYDDPVQGLHIYVEKGLQTLNGSQAMQLVRWRKNNAGIASGGGTGSDLDRLKVQQGFLKAMLKQALQIKNMSKINELTTLFSEHVEGDLSMQNILWFAKEAVFGGLSVDNVEFVTMPWKSANPYVYPDQNALLALINSKLNPFKESVTISQLDLIYFDEEGNMQSTGQQ